MKPRKKRESAAFAVVDVHVGRRIKILRKLRGMNQTKLGEAVGLSFQQIQKYETGANRIGASRLFEFSQVFDVPVSCFFDDMPPDIAGHSSTNSQGLDVFDTSEAAEVADALFHITDPDVRQIFRKLSKKLAQNDT